jgi:nitroimidazol reductase NimA-like FMN-containing flavoprotein (pyridoxamine 5'-phosphate oxidase superfamily)
MIENYEDVTGYRLDDADEAALLAAQNECTFIWSNREGWPVGVIMSYVFADGRFWLTASGQRKRIAAVERDGRVAITVTSKGTSLGANRTVTYKGRCRVHRDESMKAWFYPVLAAALRPGDPDGASRFAAFLDSPRRVVLEVEPVQRIGFDGAKMREATMASSAHRS